MLFPDQMWSGNGPTLTGQYVFKDIVLVAGGLVVAAHALGARLRVPPTPEPDRAARDARLTSCAGRPSIQELP